MKTFKSVWLASLFLVILVTSCRTEDDMSIDPPASETLVANSTLANLMTRTSLNDGSDDNIIDNASCFNVQLPVTVLVNGTEVVVTTSSDYEVIEDLFDQDSSDVDTLEIVFPISVTFEDYSTATVSSYPELLALIAQCPEENSDDDDIECVDFQYPISVSIFNQNNELVDTLTIVTDYDMYEFLEDLDEYAAVTISFPITVVLADGTEVNIESVSALQAVIEDADNSCDEDDDNDYDDDDCNDCTTEGVEGLLDSCTNWTVDDFELNDTTLEGEYDGFLFDFGAEGVITVSVEAETYSGTWSISGSGNFIDFVIDIPDFPDFNGTWNLHEIEQSSNEIEINLRKGDEDELEFKSNC